MIFDTYKKRIISFAVSVIFILSMVTIQTFAEDTAPTQMSEETKSAEQLLEMIGVIKDSDSVNTDEDMTRGYFTAMVSRVLKLGGSGAEVRTMFRDVTEDNKWADEIAAMYSMGYISGGDDRKFRPDDKITMCEAVTMAVNGLGYRQQAALRGGWPSGYLAEASRLKLLTGGTDKQTVTYSEGIGIVMNMLESETLVMSDTITQGKVEYTTEENLLSILHDVYTLEGIVTENGLTGLYCAEVNKNAISIGSTAIQNTRNEDLRTLLGMNVKLYCRKNSDNEYEYLTLKSKSRNTVYDINGMETDTQYDRDSNSIKYEDSNRTKTLKLNKDFKFIYNGKLEGNYLNYLADLSESRVKVIENNGDSYCDVLIVETYKTMVADSAGNTSTKIISKYPGFDAIDTQEYSTVEFTDIQGSTLEVSDVSRGDVISYYASTDKSYARIIKSSMSINGEIKGIAADDGEYTVDDKVYKAAPTVKNGAVTLSIGKVGTFGLDIFGRIAEFSRDIDSAEGFGLLIKYEDSDDYSGACYLKMIDEYHDIRFYKLAESVKINGTTCKRNVNSKQYKAIDNMAKLNDSDDIKEDVIRFKTNGDGEITSVDFAPEYVPDKKDVTDGMLYMYKKKATRMYKEDTGNLNDDFLVDKASTIVFGVDTNFPYGEDDRYFVMSAGAFGNDAMITSEAYTTKAEPDKAEVMVYYGIPEANAMNFFAINSIRQAVDDVGEEICIAKGFTPSGDIEAVIDADLANQLSLTAGDIVGGSSKMDSKGVLYSTELLYDYSEKKMVKDGINDVFYAERAFMIYPYSYSGNVIKWFMVTNRDDAVSKFEDADKNGVTENDLKNTLVPSGAVYVADGRKEGGIYKKGNMSDIVSYTQDPQNYSDVVVRSRWGNTQLIVIIKK